MFEILKMILKGMGIFLAVLVPFAGFFLYACKSGEKSCKNNCGGLYGCTCTFCVLYDWKIFLAVQGNEVKPEK